MVQAADAVAQPGSQARPAGLLVTRLNVGDRRVVVDCFGVERLDNGDVIDDGGDVRQELADPGAALAVLVELEHWRHAGERLLSGRHPGDALSHAYGTGQLLAVVFAQLGLVIEQVDVRRPAGHEQIDDALGLRGEV